MKMEWGALSLVAAAINGPQTLVMVKISGKWYAKSGL
jgi:hypothetical protein